MKIAALILGLLPASALAHPGHEGGSALGAALWHLLSEPDHLAVIAAPLALAIGLFVWLARRDRQRWVAAQRARRED